MKISLISLSIFIILLAIDLNVKVYFQYDLLKNIGKIRFKLFGLPIFSSEISLIGDYFNFVRKNKKVLQIKINLTDKNIKFLKDIFSYYKHKIYFISFTDDLIVSFNNSFVATMLGGFLRSSLGVFDSVVKSKNTYIDINSSVYIGYLDDVFQVEIKTHFLLNLFDLLWSVIKTIYRRSLLIYEKR